MKSNTIKPLIYSLLFSSFILCTAQVTKSNNTQGTFLGSSGVRNINFDTNDFGTTSPTIDKVTVFIEFSSEDDGIFGFTFHEDLAFRLESPSGTTVDLVYDVRGIFTGNTTQSPTYGGFTPTGTVQITFDDAATQSVASSPGGDPTTGTFVPMEPLSSFSGESPIGDWKLHLADSFDNGLYDQLFFFFASITISTQTLSMEQEDNITPIKIYPNPVQTTFQLNTNQKVDRLSISDINGKLIKTFTTPQLSYNIKDLSPGIYIVNVVINQQTKDFKLIKD